MAVACVGAFALGVLTAGVGFLRAALALRYGPFGAGGGQFHVSSAGLKCHSSMTPAASYGSCSDQSAVASSGAAPVRGYAAGKRDTGGALTR